MKITQIELGAAYTTLAYPYRIHITSKAPEIREKRSPDAVGPVETLVRRNPPRGIKKDYGETYLGNHIDTLI